MSYVFDLGLDDMPNLYLAIFASRNGIVWVLCKAYLIDIASMIENSLCERSICFPENHHTVSRAT